jgi:hypothetical protein
VGGVVTLFSISCNLKTRSKRLVRLLKTVGMVSEVPELPVDVHWIGGKTILLCTGDLIDKGDHSLDVIACFRGLQKQAEAVGGRVIVTMGNHEAEFLTAPEDDDKAEEFLQELENAHINPASIADGNDAGGIGAFLRSLPLAAKINDWFFAHACNTKGMEFATLDRELRDSVDQDGFGAKILLSKAGLLEARLKPMPWWERKNDSAEESESRLRGYAKALGIKHFVMGHQPGKADFSDGSHRNGGEMIQKFDGLIFLIDVGMSHAINKSKGAALKVTFNGNHEAATKIDADGEAQLLWKR